MIRTPFSQLTVENRNKILNFFCHYSIIECTAPDVLKTLEQQMMF